ncbi:hypothetical protein [Streptomyces sp. NPDC003247]|uniref:hypothetical protein n=1 Tax=Streptomyces sp. NPDC003247 TaxID=3364677 RepID=UPI00368724C0
MDWTAPLSAMAGALAGIVATFVVDRDRWRRAQKAEAQTVLREAFVTYLAHLARATEGMRFAAEATYETAEERRRAVRAAFSESGLFEQRFALTMLAPPRVVELGVEAFRTVRTMRDLLADGEQVTGGTFQTAQHTYFVAVQDTAAVMRQELGIAELPFVPLAPSHDGDRVGHG